MALAIMPRRECDVLQYLGSRQRSGGTKPPHRGRGPRPIPVGLHLAPVVAELDFFALGSYSRGGRKGWAAAHLGFYVLGPSPGAPLLV